MFSTIQTIAPIILTFISGYWIGKLIPFRLNQRASLLMTPLVWLLLFMVGWKFGHVLASPHTFGQSLYLSLGYAGLTTLGTFSWVLIMYRCRGSSVNRLNHLSWQSFVAPMKQCVIALGMVLFGVVGSMWVDVNLFANAEVDFVNLVLYALIFCVGLDVSQANLRFSWNKINLLFLPCGVVFGSLVGGIVASWVLEQPILTSLALSSGFGWFSLSSILVGSKLGATYGSVALLTDLLRELFAICFLYIFGARFSREGVGLSGAAASDSALPIIRQTCSSDMVPLALVSGLLLTVLAPPLILLFLSF